MVASLAGAYTVYAYTAADINPGPNHYNVAAWEVRNFPGRWLYLAGNLFHDTPSVEEQNAQLQRFFQINARINELSNESSDELSRGQVVNRATLDELNALRKERDSIENAVEYTLESRLSKVIKQEGITRNILGERVWPPVDAEFTSSPRSLATSPRDHIQLLGSWLMKEDLTLSQVEAVENEVAQKEGVSALSFPTSGVGAYPTIIDYPTSYERALEVIAHEWMHNYLAFRPLGIRYFSNNDIRTMNETVADLVGQELSKDVVQRWPVAALPSSKPPATTPPPGQPQIDVRAELRKLRGEVDDLLAQGKIDEAEALMEQRREQLDDEGYFIRKINQAYFAYLNLYAGETGSVVSTDPIGPKIDKLRELSASLKQFVDVVGSVTSVAQLDRALQSLQQP